ncbi:PREDICTED: pentatricopeptide repeat-containing protein At3g53700, chloroplastic-like isoform X1 [Nelumbo nucifera]|uniref:Pentatricopeptide repeat-containing protein At3g53700, chloroplastic-like isoform X1 n=1 Tax=Nelumbo nucifera TaxID=4432 RepID=A0A1U8B6S7_NELNU|nr:PREDICTED: pentatricopeptide repeat-containing protein At3g53700, chloroplastic-like isoform X1 [Nelumbo nucifera]XP_019055024.1 PREDICTED: pentatricopeptide repeat-containing protein At3g53700, chloroplastic-like isoform X1 [Nelumbo nucifera]
MLSPTLRPCIYIRNGRFCCRSSRCKSSLQRPSPEKPHHIVNQVADIQSLAAALGSNEIEAQEFQEESSNSPSQNPNTFAALQCKMKDYATYGLAQEAWDTLNDMKRVSGKPTVYDYNAFLYYNLKSGNLSIEDLVEVHGRMRILGPSPNALTFNTLLNGSLSLGSLEGAFYFTKEMCRNGFVPSFSFLSKLLKRSLELGDLVYSLDALELMLDLDYFPTEPTSNLLVNSFIKSGKMHEACFLLSLLSDKCFLPSMHHSYNSIIWALCKSGQTCVASALFCSLKKRGIGHNVCTYTALVHGFSREGAWKEAFHVMDEMQREGCKPNVVTYTILVKFLSDYGKIKEAQALLNKMEREGCDPDLVTYNIMLHALCRQDKIREACDLIEIIEQKGLHPNSFTYSALVGGLLKAGRIGSANKHLLDILPF